MADITNVQAVKWANERLRPMADMLTRAFWTIEKYKQDYEAQNMNTVLSASADADIFLDGSAIDGRTPITKKDMADLQLVIDGLVTAFGALTIPPENVTALAVVSKISVNGAI